MVAVASTSGRGGGEGGDGGGASEQKQGGRGSGWGGGGGGWAGAGASGGYRQSSRPGPGPCPFFLSRDLAKRAELLFVPYNYLASWGLRVYLLWDSKSPPGAFPLSDSTCSLAFLGQVDSRTRDTTLSMINWQGSIVIFDEAHNLESVRMGQAPGGPCRTGIRRSLEARNS